MLITFGKPEPVPPLGRRILPWHLAGTFQAKDSRLWNALTHYAAVLGDDAGWVRVHELPEGPIEVRAGLRDQTLLDFLIGKEAQGLWAYKSLVYECEDGGLVIAGGFPPPPVENPTGSTHGVGAKCTFFRGADGSLVMLEEQYSGVPQGNMLFSKWWRWRSLPVTIEPHDPK